MEYSSLINGKNNLEKIVSIEVDGPTSELFVQTEDGEVKSVFVPNRFWLLSPRQLDSTWKKLSGNLYFQYGKQFDNELLAQEFYKINRGNFYKLWDKRESFMVKDGYTYHKGLQHGDVSVLAFDIEATSLDLTPNAKALLISNTFRKNGKIERKLFCYDDYRTEKDFIDAWCSWVREKDPTHLVGHNCLSYDLKYLDFIAKRAGTKLYLGRDGSAIDVEFKEAKFRKESSQFIHYNRMRVYGREIIDTLFLAIKYDVATRKYETYGLKNIIKQEGLEKPDRQFYDASQIRFKYQIKEEWEKIKRYCENDADDALSLYDIMLPPFFYMAQAIPKTMQQIIETASGSQLNSMMVRSYLQNGHSIPNYSEIVEYEGAISLGIPGIYKNVLKVDVASLYPSIMLHYRVYDQKKDPNGNLLKILERFTTERLKNKKLSKETGNSYYEHLQTSQKVLINSIYGFMGAPKLNFNYPEGASFVTKTGRNILKKSIEWATGLSYSEWKQEYCKDEPTE